MALDSVKPLKLESPATGGTETDYTPCEVNTQQDAIAAAGYFVDGPTVTTADKTVFLDRALGGLLRFTDQSVSRVLNELVTSLPGKSTTHSSLLDIQHFLGDEGPGDGWASGANLRTVYNGPLLTSRTWYASSSASAAPIVRYAVTYKTGAPLAATQTWTLYTTSGAVYRTVTDTLTWSGPQLAGVIRTWA